MRCAPSHGRSFATALLLALLCVSPAAAEVGDPTIRTNHEHYPGEGAFQTVDDCVRFATAGLDEAGEQERAIALFNWMLTHQFHLASPQEWRVPGLTPGATSHPDMVVYDANRSRFSYGYGLCGTVHAWNEPYWRALGMLPRRRAFPGHVNSEIRYGGGWHAFDTDMAGLVLRADGVVAGYDDIIANPDLVKPAPGGLPCYPFAWPGDFETMKQGWQEVARGGSWYALYNGGYAAHPGVVHLRSGESFTRWFDRDHYGGPSQRRFWHKQPGGPFRDWTFVNRGHPRHEGAESNSRGNASYCNGEFVYEPNLAGGYREGLVGQSGDVAGREQSPRLHSRDGEAASVTFSHFSPYVIAGDPADDADPMSGPASGGLLVEGRAVGEVSLEVSADGGHLWREVARLGGDFSHDLTDDVKGRYGWLLRFSWSGAAGLDRLRFTTVTQVSQMIYPRLAAGGSTVVYRAASRAVTPVLPSLGLPEEAQQYEVKSMRSDNVRFAPRTKDSRYAYQTTNNKPASVVFRVDAPQRLLEVRAAVRYGIRNPPPEGADYRLDVSTDGGRSWREMSRSEIPADNEYSSGWLDGRSAIEADTASALVRFRFYAGGHTTGIIEAELYGVHQTAEPQAVELTYGWKEGGQSRRHTETIPAGAVEHRLAIATGDELVDEFVRLAVP